MSSRDTSREIDARAADWVVRADAGAFTAEERAELDAWMAGDTRRIGAYAKARAVFAYSQRARALGSDFDPDRFKSEQGESPAPPVASPADIGRGATRRRLFGYGGGAIAASLAAGVGLVWFANVRRYRTKVGEIRIVPLADGSSITLNTATELTVDYTKDRRTIRLEAGEALFDVAKDAGRPFVVEVGETRVQAIGTSFTVRRLPDRPVAVLVREGVVEVKARAQDMAAPVRLPANSRATVTSAVKAMTVATEVVPPAQVVRALSWRQGMLAFEDMRLDAAAAEFARYGGVRIVVDDPAVAAETVTGLFSASNPAGFATTVAGALDLDVQADTNVMKLQRRRPS